ncbi:MAG: Ig-like domain-containing protein [Candidatus Aquicultor sp.]
MRKLLFAIAVLALSLFSIDYAWAWSAISHYNINRDVGIEPIITFGINGTGPDMSVQWIGKDPKILDENGQEQSWPDYLHSPDPKFTKMSRPYMNAPNFAYLMLKTSEKNGVAPDTERARALGWGGHIAADWVAHNDNLFPICPDGSSGSIKHFAGECLCDLYSFLTGGPIPPSSNAATAFNDKQIYKALYNYRLISIYESCIRNKEPIYPDKLKKQALETTLPRSYIRERIKSWVAKLVVIQFAYASGPEVWNPTKRSQFIDSMEQRGIESNLALSEMSVNSWIHNPKPRGCVPDFSEQVVSFYKNKLMDIPSSVSFSQLGQVKSSSNLSAQPLVYRSAETSVPSIEEKDAILWQSIVGSSCEHGDIAVDETETSGGAYQVNVVVKDEEGLKNTIKGIIEGSAQQTGGSADAAVFWDRLLVDGESNPDLLADLFPPELTLVSPADGSFLNTASPELRLSAHDGADGADGAGIDPIGILFNLDDVPIKPYLLNDLISYKPKSKLKEGVHRALVSIIDRAGNTNQLAWSFTVDTVSPKVCYKIKSYVINSKKPAIVISIIPNEPVKYRLTVFPDIGGKADLNTIVFQEEFEQQKNLIWDGVDNNGSKIADGSYILRVQAIDRAGNARTFNRSVKIDRNN